MKEILPHLFDPRLPTAFGLVGIVLPAFLLLYALASLIGVGCHYVTHDFVGDCRALNESLFPKS